MQKIYLDNAATTPLRKEVVEEMVHVLTNDFGNPSSTHSFGRSAKTIIETSRKTIAKHLNCTAQEIIFTSSATESTNWILNQLVSNLGVKRILSSKIEHHATLHTLEYLAKVNGIQVDYVSIEKNGAINLGELENLLENSVKTAVCLMHVNNETGTVLDLKKVTQICQKNNAYFFCDTVQSVGKTEIDLKEISLDFIIASAHKFHGPKGVGFVYIKKNILINPMLYGGEQEKGMRAGTEATHQIAGLAKALELSYLKLNEEREYISNLKQYCLSKLQESLPATTVNGENTFYNILNITLPISEEKTAMILFNLDMKGIAVSRGSACQSGSIKPSHVLAAFLPEEDLKKPSLRISFSHYNTKEEIDLFVSEISKI